MAGTRFLMGCANSIPALARLLGIAVLFAFGYAVANRFQLTHGVLYRIAAGDNESAIRAFAFLTVQAVALLGLLWVAPRRALFALVVLAVASILINLAYGQIVKAPLDAGVLLWMFSEIRQAQPAAGEFAQPLILAGVQTTVAVALMFGATALLRRSFQAPRGPTSVVAAAVGLLAPSLLGRTADLWPFAAERNVYEFSAEIATAPPPPPRSAVEIRPDRTGKVPNNIVWLIDESVAYRPFKRLIAPQLKGVAHTDFGDTSALANCSAPAHVALRSGVDVRRASPSMDLRRTPSIWSYAKNAGYTTTLIDGQATGAPQNLLLQPERALIDNIRSMATDIDTDRRIAAYLNGRLRKSSHSFIYVVLRGVHFQYTDHFPRSLLPADASKQQQYKAALQWSKHQFFEGLLEKVDRSRTVIIYTSDHGQNFASGALPHCSLGGVGEELRVPLIAFLPRELATRYAQPPAGGHSASQIFPSTLIWMGYDAAKVAAQYDNDLALPSIRQVWFGRRVLPSREGDKIELFDALPYEAGATF